MAFNEINPETSKPWTRHELYTELETLKGDAGMHLAALDTVQTTDSDIISWPRQSANLRARWAIHQDEFNIAIKDLKTLAKAIQVFIENQKEYWQANPLLKQQ